MFIANTNGIVADYRIERCNKSKRRVPFSEDSIMHDGGCMNYAPLAMYYNRRLRDDLLDGVDLDFDSRCADFTLQTR